MRKGDRLYIEGRMEYDTYEKNGVTIPTAQVRVRELVMLGSPAGRPEPEDAEEEEEEEEEAVEA